MVLRSLRKKVTRLEKEGGKHEEEEEVSQTEGRKNEVISQKVTARITTVQTRDINLQRFFFCFTLFATQRCSVVVRIETVQNSVL